MDEVITPARDGEILGPLIVEVTAERVQAYADASGDHNPIHLDPVFAATTDFGAPIVHGMLLLAYLSHILTARFGRAWATTGTLEARFRSPAMVGATVTVQGSVEKIEEEPSGQHVHCRLTCVDEKNQGLISATVALRLPAWNEG